MTTLTSLITQHNTQLTSRPTLTHLDYVLVDGSSSMRPKWWNFLTAADTMLDDIRASGLNTRLIVHVFDGKDIKMVQRDGPIATERKLLDDPISSHFHTTPLYDAINVMGRRLQELMPQNASLLIITDGKDNASVTSSLQARAVLDWCKANGWQITFLGCDFHNEKQALELGLTERNAIGVSSANMSAAAKAFALKRIKYGHGGPDIGFSDDEKAQFGGYLGHTRT